MQDRSMNGIQAFSVVVCWLTCLVVVSTASKYSKGKQCYQCAWAPDKLVVRTEKVTLKVPNPYDPYGKPKTKVVTRLVSERQSGGWQACEGPFTHYEALDAGIDMWECEDNCMTRVDKQGNVYRGCYRGEHGVVPTDEGCQVRGESMYCFCKGERCNNQRAPAFETNDDVHEQGKPRYVVLYGEEHDGEDDEGYGNDDNRYDDNNEGYDNDNDNRYHSDNNNNGYDNNNNNRYDRNDDHERGNSYHDNNRHDNNNRASGYHDNDYDDNDDDNRYETRRYDNHDDDDDDNNGGYGANRHQSSSSTPYTSRSRNTRNHRDNLKNRYAQLLASYHDNQRDNNDQHTGYSNGNAGNNQRNLGYINGGNSGDDEFPLVTKVEILDTRQYPIRSQYRPRSTADQRH